MRSAALLCVAGLTLAGCYDDEPGLRVVIQDPGLGAVKVELFLATRSSPAESVGADAPRPSEERTKLDGRTFFLDGPVDGVTPLTTLDLEGGRAVWNLQADPRGPSRVKLLVVVAYDSAGTAVAVGSLFDSETTPLVIPADDAIAYVLQLNRAKEIEPSDTPEPAGIRVWPWRKAGAPATAACLGLELSDGLHAPERVWLVPEDDPDCDEVTAAECDGYFWHASGAVPDPSLADVNCFEGVGPTPAGMLSACRLGVRSCVDGEPTSGTCDPLANPSYCVARTMCNPAACQQAPAMCGERNTSAFVGCRFLTDQQGGQCTKGVNKGPMKVDLSPMFPTGCADVAFVDFDVLANGVEASPLFTTPQGAGTLTIEQFDNATCSFEVSLNGKLDAGPEPLLLGLDVRQAGNDHWLVPFALDADTTMCATISPCVVAPADPTDGLDRCQ